MNTATQALTSDPVLELGGSVAVAEGDAHTNESLHNWIRMATEVCQDAARGDLEARVLNIPADGPLTPLLHSINQLLDMTDAFVRESSASLSYASRGKFFRRVMQRGMLGSFRRAAENINHATEFMAGEAKALRDAEESRMKLVEEFRATTEVVKSLETASGEIGNVADVIRAITSQTSMLALNASIEAARVGDAGRGFAVVANEVKALSQQTSDAANGIRQQIAAIQGAARNTAEAIERISTSISDSARRNHAGADA